MKMLAFGNTQADISKRNKIVRTHHEWMAVLDAVDDLIFLHDLPLRVLSVFDKQEGYRYSVHTLKDKLISSIIFTA